MRFASIEQAASGAAATLRRFPMSLLSGFVAFAAALTLIDSSGAGASWRLLAVAAAGLPLFTSARTAAERLRAGASRLWLAYVVVAAGLGAVYALSLGWTDDLAVLRMIQLLLLAHLAVATAPYIGADRPNGFWQYNRFLLLRYLEASFYAVVLFIGLAIALGALHKLFGIDVPSRSYPRLMAVLAFVFHPWFFLAGVPGDFDALEAREDYPLGLKVFSQFVLIPLVTVYLVILTAYLGKVVITRTWPSGWIGYLVSSVSVLGVLALLLVHPIRRRGDTRWVNAYGRWWFVVLLPSLVMLMLAVSKRIGQYGITEERYFLMVLSLWMLGLSLYYGISGSTGIKRIPESLLLVVFLSAVGPWSAFAVSERSQVARLGRIFELSGMGAPGHSTPHRVAVSDTDREQVSAVLRYLASRHGPGSVGRVLGVPADSTELWPGGVGSDRIAREAMRRMGLEYTDQEYSADNTTFYANTGGGGSTDVSGFEVVRRMSFPLSTWLTNGTDSLEIASDSAGGGIVVRRARVMVMTIDLAGPLGAALSRGSGDRRSSVMLPGPLVLEGAGGGYRVRVAFDNIYGDRPGGVIKVTGGEGLVMAAGLRKTP